MKKGNRSIMKIVFIVLICIIVLYLVVQLIRCRIEVKKAYQHLETYDAKTISLSYGNMTYIDQGEGDPILVVHGIFGGYDQGFDGRRFRKDCFQPGRGGCNIRGKCCEDIQFIKEYRQWEL